MHLSSIPVSSLEVPVDFVSRLHSEPLWNTSVLIEFLSQFQFVCESFVSCHFFVFFYLLTLFILSVIYNVFVFIVLSSCTVFLRYFSLGFVIVLTRNLEIEVNENVLFFFLCDDVAVILCYLKTKEKRKKKIEGTRVFILFSFVFNFCVIYNILFLSLLFLCVIEKNVIGFC